MNFFFRTQVRLIVVDKSARLQNKRMNWPGRMTKKHFGGLLRSEVRQESYKAVVTVALPRYFDHPRTC